MNSCAAVTGLICLVITDLAIIISFATPYWLEMKIGQLLTAIGFGALGAETNRGLWAYCKADECVWLFEDRFHGYGMDQDWFHAVQGLMTVALAVGLVALIIATLALCCQCRDCNYGGVVAGLLITAFLAMATAVVVFGVKASDELRADINFEKAETLRRFGWSFWLAAGAAGMSLLTSFIYCCSCYGRRD